MIELNASFSIFSADIRHILVDDSLLLYPPKMDIGLNFFSVLFLVTFLTFLSIFITRNIFTNCRAVITKWND